MNRRVMGSLVPGPTIKGRKTRRIGAFTIVELLASTAIFAIILTVIFGITQQISSAWKNSSTKIEAFQGARGAFTAMTEQISQATLNTYYDYYDLGGNTRVSGDNLFVPDHYGRCSDLHFISGGWSTAASALLPNQITQAIFFQSPAGYATGTPTTDYSGMGTLMNACGFYINYNQDTTRPEFLDDATLPKKPENQYRFRLMQFFQPSEGLSVYDKVHFPGNKWFTTPLGLTDSTNSSYGKSPGRILANNIIALVILPRLSKSDGSATALAPLYEYNSRPQTAHNPQERNDHQIPPVLEIVLVAIDEASAQRVCTGSTVPTFGLAGGLSGLFKQATLLDADILTLSKALEKLNLTYRVFRTQVAVRGAKWTEQ